MKILFVRTYCPHKIAYGSELRANNFVNFFRKIGKVDLLTLTKPNETTDVDYIRGHFLNFFYIDEHIDHSRLNAIEKLFFLLPWQITTHYAKDIQKEINKIVKKENYDLIFVFKLEPVFYFLNLPKQWHQRIIIDFDDILSQLYRNHYKNIFTAYKNSLSLKLYEHKALNAFSRTLVCSKDALSKAPAMFRHKIGIVPNVFQFSKESFFPESQNKNNLLFVGSLDYFPNIEGLNWFCREIWPEFKRAFPNITLTVVGKTGKDPKKLNSLLGNPKDMEVIVNVTSVEPYYQNCFASIVPLLNGSGTRLKILESIAYGRPVLTTIKGVEGLEFTDQEDICLFKDSDSFIDQYKKLLDENQYRNLTRNSFSVLEKNYSVDNFLFNMNQNMELLKTI
jgi:hypothetical protein